MELAMETKLSQKPALMEYDSRALTSTEQHELNRIKINMRIENERYLRRHPEVSEMIAAFTSKVLLDRPDDLKEFAADFFLQSNLEEQLKQKS